MLLFLGKLNNKNTHGALIGMFTHDIFHLEPNFKPIAPKCNGVEYFEKPLVLSAQLMETKLGFQV
jgi:hypothetical protein